MFLGNFTRGFKFQQWLSSNNIRGFNNGFQVTTQKVSTMIRYGQHSIIFLLNNGGYKIKVEIHDGPYNIIKN
jgi:hypothetical protein